MTAILLVVAALAIRQVDWSPATYDEFFSMFDAGWIGDDPQTPIDIVRSFIRTADDSMPVYFVLLNLWGHLVGQDILLARTLSIFFALAGLALTYRLGRDFVSPTAGFFAAIMLASNAFYNVYIPHARAYSLLLMASALVLWLYLRITYRVRAPNSRDYLALLGAGSLLLYTHAFGFFYVGVLGLFHLLVAPKNRTWLRSLLTAAAALAVFALYSPVLYSAIENSTARWTSATTDAQVALWKFFEIATNNIKHLLVIPAFGLALEYAAERRIKPIYVIALLYWIALAALAQFTDLVSPRALRFFITGLPVTIVALAAGLAALIRYRRTLGFLVLLWVATGLSFQRSGYIDPIVAGLADYSGHVPWQVVSRLARNIEDRAAVVGYRIDTASLDRHSHSSTSRA